MGVLTTLGALASGTAIGVGSLTVAMWDQSTPEADRAAYTAAVAVEGCPQLKDDRQRWVTATAVAIAESGARPEAHNPNPPDNSYGLWQINMLGRLEKPRQDQYGIESNDELFTPLVNAKAMCMVSGGGENWSPWSVYTSGAYLGHLSEAEQAVSKAAAGVSGPAQPGGEPVGDARGRVCGVGEWLDAGNDCVTSARDRADYLWDSLGDVLDDGDTERLHAVWQQVNGKPADAKEPAVQPGPTKGIDKDLPNLPGSEGLQADFAASLARMVASAPGSITINQGWRSAEDALNKWNDKLEDTGGDEVEARRWVAKTTQDDDGNIQCGSNHCKGLAADLAYADSSILAWAHNHAHEYQLKFPLDNEPWHIEPEGIR